MEKFVVSKEISIEYGHRVPNHASKCRAIHGHSGLVRVHIAGPLNANDGHCAEGMVVDFADIKKILVGGVDYNFDHAFITCVQDHELLYQILSAPHAQSIIQQVTEQNWFMRVEGYNQFFTKLVVLPCIPTAENLAHEIFRLVAFALPKTLKLVKVEFWETRTSCAIVEAT